MRLGAIVLLILPLLAIEAAGQAPPPDKAPAKTLEWKADCVCAVAGTAKFMGVININAANLEAFRKLLAAGSGEIGSTLILTGKKCDKPALCGKSYTDPTRQLNNTAIDGPRTIKVNSNAGLPRDGAALKPEKLAAGDQLVVLGDPAP